MTIEGIQDPNKAFQDNLVTTVELQLSGNARLMPLEFLKRTVSLLYYHSSITQLSDPCSSPSVPI